MPVGGIFDLDSPRLELKFHHRVLFAASPPPPIILTGGKNPHAVGECYPINGYTLFS